MNICKHLDDCLQRTSDPNNKDADGIRAGVKARNGQIVLAGADACARDLGRKLEWDKWALGVQNSSLSKLLRWDWNLERSIATGIHNSEPLESRSAQRVDGAVPCWLGTDARGIFLAAV